MQPQDATPLAGDLDRTSFPELLGLLDGSRASGRLTVEAGATVRRLFFSSGRLAGVDEDSLDDGPAIGWVSDVVLELCALRTGAFRFEEGPVAPAATDLSADQLLTAAERRVSQWQQVTQYVPSTNAVPRLAATPPSDHAVVIAAPDWSVLALIDGRRSVGDVVVDSGRRPFEVFETLARLVSAGLVAVDYVDGPQGVRH